MSEAGLVSIEWYDDEPFVHDSIKGWPLYDRCALGHLGIYIVFHNALIVGRLHRLWSNLLVADKYRNLTRFHTVIGCTGFFFFLQL
jgi:hypothetical protein